MLSKRIQSVKESEIRKIFELAVKGGDDFINLSIGQPDFPVPDELKNALVKAVQEDKNGYAPTQGILSLREKIAGRLKKNNKIDARAEDIIVTSGTSGGIFLLLSSIIDPGDEVIITDPYFVLYKEVLTFLGANIRYLDTYPDFRIDAGRLKELITDKTKALIINSPNNPTGAVYSEQELRAVAEIAEEHGLLIISDEIYESFDYDDKFFSIGSIYKNTATLNGFSKNYAITGWRVGYVHAPGEIIEEMKKLQMYTFVCAPSIAQYALDGAFDIDISRQIGLYAKKRDFVFSELYGLYQFIKPEGAFYGFIRIPDGRNNFIDEATKNNLLIVPGNAFSGRNDHFRISFAVNDDILEKGIDILKKIR